MPYIKKEDRERLSPLVRLMDEQDIKTAGELNYLITMLTHRYLNQKPESYQMYNDAVGALEGAKLELYRRHVAQYEDEKIKENGDV
jgi:hypothetical protein